MREEMASLITQEHLRLHPELDKKYGPIGREKCHEDARYHLNYLAEAVGAGQPDLFADYVLWAKFMLQGRGVPPEDLIDNLKVIREVAASRLSKDAQEVAVKCIDAGLDQLMVGANASQGSSISAELPCRITQDNPLCELATTFLNALLRGERQEASAMIFRAIDDGIPIKSLYLNVFQPSQHEVGRLWQINELTVAQEHYCTAATQLIMSQLYPHIFSTEKNGRSMVATCVSGDLHEIGVRMISDFFEMEGWDTFYLGANVPVDSVVRSIKDRRADLLAVSATMTYHVGAVRKLIEAVRKDELTKATRIIVGGYPFNLAPTLWQEIGADGHATDAERSVSLAEQLLKTS